MFGKLKEKLKKSLSIFSRKAEEEAEVKEEALEEIKEKPTAEELIEESKENEEPEIIVEKPVEKKKPAAKEQPSTERLIIDSEEQEPPEKIAGVKITYFVHGTTTDNEHDLATGWNPGELSPAGELQARELGKAVADQKFAVIFTSDLKRAVDSTNLGFKNRYRIIQDQRLRECNYGLWNSKKKNWNIADYIINRYPNGESYSDVEKRMAEFLNYLYKNYYGKQVAIVAACELFTL